MDDIVKLLLMLVYVLIANGRLGNHTEYVKAMAEDLAKKHGTDFNKMWERRS